jgi:hypothetical protein
MSFFLLLKYATLKYATFKYKLYFRVQRIPLHLPHHLPLHLHLPLYPIGGGISAVSIFHRLVINN